MILGQSIKFMRKKNNLTQDQLAELAGIEQKQISKIESGRVHARLSTYLRIANAFSVSIDVLLDAALLRERDCTTASHLYGEPEQNLFRELLHSVLRYLKETEV